MGLFQKKETPVIKQSYTIGNQDTALIVGLGNFGDDYAGTRHNFGFMCIDDFALKNDFAPWVEKKDLRAWLCAKVMNGKKVILCKPTTYMNLSGEAVLLVKNFYKLKNPSIAVVYDELDLPFGTIRTAVGGSSAGHNGVKSLVKHTEDAFWRLRVGVGPKTPEAMETSAYVLQKFSKGEQGKLPVMYTEVGSMLHDYLASSGIPTPETRTVF